MVNIPKRDKTKTLDQMAGSTGVTRRSDDLLSKDNPNSSISSNFIGTGDNQNRQALVVEDDDPEILVEVLGAGQSYNQHQVNPGTVISMKTSDVDLHRERGHCLGPVPEDYEGEVYDISEPWKPPQNEERPREGADAE